MGTKRFGILAGLGVIGVAGALVVGAAAAQAPIAMPEGMHQAVVARAAASLGVPEANLNAAFALAHGQVLDDAVRDGQLTQAQADWMKQHHAAMQGDDVASVGGMMAPGMMVGRGPMMGGRFGGGHGPLWAATATPSR